MSDDQTANEPNFYEANRELFEELDRVSEAAADAMAVGDMDAWGAHAGRGAEIYREIADRAGWNKPAEESR